MLGCVLKLPLFFLLSKRISSLVSAPPAAPDQGVGRASASPEGEAAAAHHRPLQAVLGLVGFFFVDKVTSPKLTFALFKFATGIGLTSKEMNWRQKLRQSLCNAISV